MKRFATVFIGCVALLVSSTAFSQVMKMAQPVPTRQVYKSPFLVNPRYIPLGANPASALGASEVLGYYSEDFNDFALFLAGNDTVLSNDQEEYYVYGFAQRFTTNFTRSPKIDSIQVSIVIDDVPTTSNIAVSVWRQRFDTTNDAEFLIPRIDMGQNPIFPVTSSMKKSGSQLVDDELQTVTFKMPATAKLPLVDGERIRDFFVLLSRVGDPLGPESGIHMDNMVRYRFDSVVMEDRDFDKEIDRAIYVGLNADRTRYLNGPLAKRYIPAGEDPESPTLFFYPNMVMNAYITDPNASAEDHVVDGFSLQQNYPNPFNPNTTITYTLGERRHVSLKVYNSLGAEVATLLDGIVDAGAQHVNFSAKDLPTGTYTYTLRSGNYVNSRRMVLAK